MNKIKIATTDHQASVEFIPEQGGMATSIQLPDPTRPGHSRELLYAKKGWPFCFPICGRLNRNGKNEYLHEHHLYTMNIHGFAASLPWEVRHHNTQELVLSLRANDLTRAQYPFEFEVTLNYQFQQHALVCEQTYTNHGKTPMPYYAGFHPYFWIDPSRYAKKDVQLYCHATKRMQYNETLTDVIGERPLFNLPIAISDKEVNESLLLLNENHSVELRFPDHSKIVMSVKGLQDPGLFRYLQLYHVPDEPFFCIEPWMGHPNALNTATATRLLAPGQSEQARLILSLSK